MAFRRKDLDVVTCPVCHTRASLNYLRFHAIMRHRLSERGPIYDLLIQRTLTEEYTLPPSDNTRLSLEDITPAELLLALRSGTPPRYGLRAITVGRHKILSDLQGSIQRAASGQGICHLLNGPPGAGKSHILNYVREAALIEDAGVFKVDIAGDGVSFSEMDSVLDVMLDHGLLPRGRTAAWNEGAFDRALLQELEQYAKEEIADQDDELYSDDDVLNKMRRPFLSIAPQTASRLILRLEKYLPRFRPPPHILMVEQRDPDLVEFAGGLSSLLQELGHRPCVFLVDELEEDRYRASYETLAHLIDNVPDGTCWVMAATPDLLWSPQNGIDVVSKDLMPTFREIAIDLPPFSRSELDEFAERVLTVYGVQQPGINPNPDQINEFCSRVARARGSPRELLIPLLSYLDGLPTEYTSGEKT